MQSMFINNDGGGFANKIEAEKGTTVAALFQERVPNGKPADYLIRVNRQIAVAEQVLKAGDRVSFTPVKIEGAAG